MSNLIAVQSVNKTYKRGEETLVVLDDLSLEVQKKMAEAQNKLNDIEVEGTSGGGLIKVTATAKGIFKRISIDDSLIKQDEKEILEDLIVAAINDAKEKGEAAAQEEMK